jgi:hypothetical protein
VNESPVKGCDGPIGPTQYYCHMMTNNIVSTYKTIFFYDKASVLTPRMVELNGLHFMVKF